MLDRFCCNPWDWLDVTAWDLASVKLSYCIASWASHESRLRIAPYTDIANEGLGDIWNCETLKEVRRQWLAGVADICKSCPRLSAGIAPPVPRASVTDSRYSTDTCDGPRIVNLAYDTSCNLCCPSCRTNRTQAIQGSSRYAKLIDFQERFIKSVLRTANRAFLAGLGDPFGSMAYWNLLTTLTPDNAPELKWHIQTNGQGFTSHAYAMIPTRAQIDSVQFSVDAARSGTYAINRKASWNAMLRNMEFIAGLRTTGAIDAWAISMVAQANNWREMEEFVELAKRHHCDCVVFNALLKMALMSTDYEAAAVHRPEHPEHEAFREALDRVAKSDGINVVIEMERG